MEDNWLVQSDDDAFVDQPSLEDDFSADYDLGSGDNEGGMAIDIDGDGINESFYQEVDDDGDGYIDTYTLESDVDGDGQADSIYMEVDTNADGYTDQASAVEIVDTDGDGQKDTWAIATDLNLDGVPDESMTVADSDADGAADVQLASGQVAVGNVAASSDATPVDLDGDGTNESYYQEVDSNNDGYIDTRMVESDLDGDGIADVVAIGSDTDVDGVADEMIYAEATDTDGDGSKESWNVSIDYDGDGVADESVVAIDTDGDGVPDTENPDTQVATDSENLFDTENPDIVGDPEGDAANWHQQAEPDTCAVVSQEFILDEMTGRDFTEEELTQQALDNGWYTPGGGTPMECVGNLLEANGIEIEKEYGCTLDDISQKLADGENVIVGIDADETWYPGGIDSDQVLSNVSGMPEQGSNHAVQVIGVDYSDPDNPVVILNDPGTPEGQGIRVDADDFMAAWEDSDNFMVSTVSEMQVARV
jgi:hypothetical protein